MKRLTALAAAIVFTACTIFTAPASFAVKDTSAGYKKPVSEKNTSVSNKGISVTEKKSDTEKKFVKEKTVTKDTSWFDYKDPKDSYKISTEAQLIGLCSLVNEEQTDSWKPERLENFEGVTFTLVKDIKLTQPWRPIGMDDSVYFAGTFDGNGHTISNVKIDNPVGASGFFGYLVGEVRNLNIEGKNKTQYSNSGGIAGILSETGSIMNCTSNVEMSGNDKCGGIAGSNEGGYIDGCVNMGKVSGTFKVGGIVGENWGGKVIRCGNKGDVKSTRRGVATYGTGGVAGRSVSPEALVSECYNTGKITSNTEATGGVVGYMNAIGSSVEDCYNTGMISINIKSSDKEISPAYAGGIVGTAGVKGVVIRNCYNTGAINNADVAGGILGKYQNETDYDVNERYIMNNYYILNSLNSSSSLISNDGIGVAADENDDRLNKAATSVSAGSMHNLTTSLSVAYIKDTGEYGNGGYPVLSWQKPASSMEKEYFKDIPEKIQRKLDKYLIETADKKQHGQIILDILSPHNSTANAFILYNEAKDKMGELKDRKGNE